MPNAYKNWAAGSFPASEEWIWLACECSAARLPANDMANVDDRRDPLLDGLQYLQLFPGWSRTLDTDVRQCPVQSPPITAAMGFVIQLRRNLSGIPGICHDAGSMNVVGMARTMRFVSDDHLRLIAFDELGDPAGGGLDGDTAESAFAVLRVPPCHARVVVTEQFELRDSQVFAGAEQLALPDVCHLPGIMAVLAGLDATGSVTESAIRTRDDNRLYPLQGIVRQDATGRGGLVVGMGVYGHQRQL